MYSTLCYEHIPGVFLSQITLRKMRKSELQVAVGKTSLLLFGQTTSSGLWSPTMVSPTLSVTISDRLWSIAKASRFPSWVFGPFLYAIGVVHSRVIPRSFVSLLRAGLQVFALSIPLCISM